MQFVAIDAEGRAENAGWAPHLDLAPIGEKERRLVADVLASPWVNTDLERLALAHATERIVPEHFTEVKERRERTADRIMAAVQARLVKEINFWQDRYLKLQEDQRAGKDVRMNLENVRRTIEDLTVRLERRKRDLAAMRHVISATPVIAGGALVIPAGLLAARRGENRC